MGLKVVSADGGGIISPGTAVLRYVGTLFPVSHSCWAISG
jgi:hypothetical protein